MTQEGRYLRLFVSEASERVERLGRLWPRLAGQSFQEDSVAELFRHAHSIKGMAASMGFGEIVALSRAAEQLMGALRSERASLPETALPRLVQTSDLLAEMIGRRNAGEEPVGDDRVTAMIAELESLILHVPRLPAA